ncbi:hypothetical protein P9314_03005 [Paenibacillus validus]|uniref:hypothetical protein n=1 Tax=Paenibacillus validus TaxID=44253 RepID=UPI001FD61D02|nr:hypothetical protein [Paenibacillus validus]MED4599673.1 hypothetical protein [Paenibacillus validus]MED4604894.1 hypothetical protein [Paenibacillus validus]
MSRGGKRAGAGRKAQGITRKVSLTLTEEQWNQIESSGEPTVAAYIQSLMYKVTPIIKETKIHSESSNTNHREYQGLKRKEAEEYWSIFANFEESAAPEVLEGARAVFLRVLFPMGVESAQLEVKPNFICPFTGKRFGSVKAMIKAAVPHLAESERRRLEKLMKSQ